MWGSTMIVNQHSAAQRGYTLIELMIGMLVGFIVLSAVIYAFIATLKSSKDVVNSTRLNMEMSVITSMVTGELRRTGYWPASGAGSSPYGASPDLEFYPSEISANCVLYSYYNDASLPGGRVDRGFALVGNEILFGSASLGAGSCDTSGWEAINASQLVSVGLFSVTCQDIGGAASCAHEAGVTKYRKLEVEIDAVHSRDPLWSVKWKDDVYLPNTLGD